MCALCVRLTYAKHAGNACCACVCALQAARAVVLANLPAMPSTRRVLAALTRLPRMGDGSVRMSASCGTVQEHHPYDVCLCCIPLLPACGLVSRFHPVSCTALRRLLFQEWRYVKRGSMRNATGLACVVIHMSCDKHAPLRTSHPTVAANVRRRVADAPGTNAFILEL